MSQHGNVLVTGMVAFMSKGPRLSASVQLHLLSLRRHHQQLGFRVSGFGVSGFGFRIDGQGFRVSNSDLGLGSRVWGLGSRVSGSEHMRTPNAIPTLSPAPPFNPPP
jgi:hypothetical protein